MKNRQSNLGCCFNLGSIVISWFSRKQTSVALSSAEVEYIATCMVAQEASYCIIWTYVGVICDFL